MMPKDFAELIKSTGYTRVVIRPRAQPEELTVVKARELVDACSVSLRGWDYPHISRRDDEHGGSETFAEFAQNWCDWYHQREFWRMYKSGQFLHYKALREDLINDDGVPTDRPILAVGSLTFTVTEMTEFVYRLFRHGIYQAGAHIHFTIGRTRGRELWIDDPNRMPFTTPRVTSSEDIQVARDLSPADLSTIDPKDASLSMLLEIFDAFGWSASSDQVRRKQEELYGLRLGRG